MNRKSKTRITTNGSEFLLSDNPFALLDPEGLPDGPDTKPIEPKTVSGQFDGRVEVRLEKSGRGGKQVTVLREFPNLISPDELGAITLSLKKTFACGGSLKGRAIELQGDVCERAMEGLKKLGFKPVRAGG